MSAIQLFDGNGHLLKASNGYYPPLRETSYSGASVVPKELSTWLPLLGSPDADLLPELGALMARSRDLARNHGIAASSLQTLTDNVVGYGLRLSAMPDYRALGRDKQWAHDWARNVESYWRSWSTSVACDATQQMNFAGLTALMFRSLLLNGDAVALALWLPDRMGQFATTLQLIESDRLSNPDHTPATETLRGGIRMDAYGAPLGYYIRKTHPGDWWLGYGFGSGEWEYISAFTEWGRRRVIRLHDMDRTGQTRGKPLFAPVLEQFKMFDHYQRVELQSAIVNALVAATLETPMDAASIAELIGGDPGAYLANKNEYRVHLRGGAVIPLYPGDVMKPFTPARPASQYPSFVNTVLRHIATALNLPYELLVKDFSQTTYASARAAIEEFRRYVHPKRAALAAQWADAVYELWLEEAIDKELVEAPGFYEKKAFYLKSKWLGPGRSTIDPVKEAQASQLRLQNGLSTLEIECAELGLDWQDIAEQLAVEIARFKQLGIWDDMMALRSPAQAIQTGLIETNEPEGGSDAGQ